MTQQREPGYPATPELDKMLAAKGSLGTQEIATFVEWLQGEGIVLAQYHEHDESCRDDEDELVCGFRENSLYPIQETFQKLLYRYADIDPAKIEQERRAVLEWAVNRGDPPKGG